MDRNADLINVAIEELVKESCELPAFSTLDRLAGNVRSITNHRLFQQVASKLTPVEQTFLDLGLQVQALLQSHGGATELLERCQEITTYNSDNYLPLIRHFFGRYRPLLFELVRSLELQSTSQDRSLPVALEFVSN